MAGKTKMLVLHPLKVAGKSKLIPATLLKPSQTRNRNSSLQEIKQQDQTDQIIAIKRLFISGVILPPHSPQGTRPGGAKGAVLYSAAVGACETAAKWPEALELLQVFTLACSIRISSHYG